MKVQKRIAEHDGKINPPLEYLISLLSWLEYSLDIPQFEIAGVADACGQLKAHVWDRVFTVRAAVAHSLSASAAVVLTETQLLLVHHRTNVPEEGTTAQLASVALHPLWRLKSKQTIYLGNIPLLEVLEFTLFICIRSSKKLMPTGSHKLLECCCRQSHYNIL